MCVSAGCAAWPDRARRGNCRLFDTGRRNPARGGLSAGGRWIRTISSANGPSAFANFPGPAYFGCSGYRGHAYTSRRGGRHGSAFLLLRLEPLHRAGLEHGMSRLWRAALRGGFVVLTVKLKYTFALYRLDQQSLNAQTKASTRSGEYPAAARSTFAWWRHTASKWCRIRRSRRSATPPISILWQACCI